MAQDVTQWTAGGLALRTIARWIIDGGDTTKMREFIRWLTPDDVVQTEHVFIVGALKRLDSAGEELSLDRLEATIAAQDPAGFVRMVLQRIVDSRHAGPSPAGGPEFAELMTILTESRGARDRESLEAKRNAVNVARSVLERATGVIDGARQLAWVENEFGAEERQTFAIFFHVADAAEDYPEGPMRKHWAADALAQKDVERGQLERDAWPDIEMSCKKLIDRWAAV